MILILPLVPATAMSPSSPARGPVSQASARLLIFDILDVRVPTWLELQDAMLGGGPRRGLLWN